MSKPKKVQSKAQVLSLSLAALGVVYGDIGTSPLYAINQIMFGPSKLARSPENVLGAISLVIWALTIIVAFKYIVLVLRADNDGEGGVFALYSLLYKISKKGIGIITLLLILAAGLLFGDGIITPAISVLSAVEGLKTVTATFNPFIIPITVGILTALFLIQSKGTSKVGKVFGPVVVIWFLVIGFLGLRQILQTPQILMALNPIYLLSFVTHHSITTLFLVLGSVMLVLTGGEAMYADMGHFGKLPIRLSWFSIVFPALLLNYIGQGAFLLSGQRILSENVFYSLVPSFALIPMVVLATFATIIASQALISGAFSLFSQAVALGLSPFAKIIHTHYEHEGQIYVPFINWSLYVGCIILIFIFRSSANLASAYGLAVSGVMYMTSVAMMPVARYYWKWSRLKAFAVFLPLSFIDLTFLSANSLKLLEGGFIPLSIGVIVLFFLTDWQWGRKKVRDEYHSAKVMKVKDLIDIKKKSTAFIPRSVIVMTPDLVKDLNDKIPLLEQVIYERYKIISKHIVFLTVNVAQEPYSHENRHNIYHLYDSKTQGTLTSVQLNYGFMEEIDVEKMLEKMSKDRCLPIFENHKEWVIEALHERIIPSETISLTNKFRLFFYRLMARNTDTADQFFGLGDETKLAVEIVPVRFP